MKLRSIELVLPEAEKAHAFMTDIWGTASAGQKDGTYYIRGSGIFPYLVAFQEGERCFVRSITFVCNEDELSSIVTQANRRGLAIKREISVDLGGGEGVIVALPDGELLRFLVGAEEVSPMQGQDLPVKLTHVVLNATDAEETGNLVEEVLNFRVSDRTKGMVFVRCNDAHHSIAFARVGFASLNHIAFEMADIDGVMRGIGRLRDHQMSPSWGPGRHGPGANVFAYFVAPFGAVVEFSTAVEKITDDYQVGAPEDWVWPINRIDQWGTSDKDFEGLRRAEENFKFYRDWEPDPWVQDIKQEDL